MHPHAHAAAEAASADRIRHEVKNRENNSRWISYRRVFTQPGPTAELGYLGRIASFIPSVSDREGLTGWQQPVTAPATSEKTTIISRPGIVIHVRHPSWTIIQASSRLTGAAHKTVTYRSLRSVHMAAQCRRQAKTSTENFNFSCVSNGGAAGILVANLAR